MLPACTELGCPPCIPQARLVLPSSEHAGGQGCSRLPKPPGRHPAPPAVTGAHDVAWVNALKHSAGFSLLLSTAEPIWTAKTQRPTQLRGARGLCNANLQKTGAKRSLQLVIPSTSAADALGGDAARPPAAAQGHPPRHATAALPADGFDRMMGFGTFPSPAWSWPTACLRGPRGLAIKFRACAWLIVGTCRRFLLLWRYFLSLARGWLAAAAC